MKRLHEIWLDLKDKAINWVVNANIHVGNKKNNTEKFLIIQLIYVHGFSTN